MYHCTFTKAQVQFTVEVLKEMHGNRSGNDNSFQHWGMWGILEKVQIVRKSSREVFITKREFKVSIFLSFH